MPPVHFQIAPDCGFTMEVDPGDYVQRDILSHFQRGQTYEHETGHLIARTMRPGDSFVDIGANVGYFCLLAATLGRAPAGAPPSRILAIEPTPGNLRQLRANAALNGFDILVEPLAVSSKAGETVFGSHGQDGGNGDIVVGKRVGDALSEREFVVRTDTLDAILARSAIDRVKILKVDTEGHETEVFKGAQDLLSAGRVDFILCELNIPRLALYGSSQDELRGLLRRHGYECFLLDHKGGLPLFVPPGVAIDQPYTCNVLFCRPEALAPYWPSVRNLPAAIHIAAKP